MNRRHLLASAAAFAAASTTSFGESIATIRHADDSPFAPDLRRLRQLAKAVPGPLPERINAVKVADSIRPRRFIIEGGDDAPHVMSRSLYQLVYPGGTVMVDSGMDTVTHREFGAEGKPFTDPFYPDVHARVLRALDEATGIFLTHHHADHVGGLVRSPNRAALLAKSWITRATADLMGGRPHKPSVALDPAELRSSILLDYDDFLPVAPGLVAIMAPAHSPDHQMVFVVLSDGREFLLSIDSAWHMDNIREVRLKAAPWVKEDGPRLLEHYRWLKHLVETEQNLTVLVTHDDDQLAALSGTEPWDQGFISGPDGRPGWLTGNSEPRLGRTGSEFPDRTVRIEGGRAANLVLRWSVGYPVRISYLEIPFRKKVRSFFSVRPCQQGIKDGTQSLPPFR